MNVTLFQRESRGCENAFSIVPSRAGSGEISIQITRAKIARRRRRLARPGGLRRAAGKGRWIARKSRDRPPGGISPALEVRDENIIRRKGETAVAAHLQRRTFVELSLRTAIRI